MTMKLELFAHEVFQEDHTEDSPLRLIGRLELELIGRSKHLFSKVDGEFHYADSRI